MWLSEFEIVLRDRVIPCGAVRIEDGLIAEVRETPVDTADIRGGITKKACRLGRLFKAAIVSALTNRRHTR